MAKTAVTLGIDIGGTNSVFGFVDREGKVLAEASIPTNADEPASMLLARLAVITEEVFEPIKSTCELKGIGIGAPNANYYRGTVENPPNLKWDGIVNIVELIQSKYSLLPVAITNDANAAAIGEMTFGAAKGMKNFIVITLGTGLGSGIVVNGDLLYGHDGFAGEIGHTTVFPDGRYCGCGKRGCLETYVSAGGLCRTVFEILAESREESKLRTLCFSDLTSKKIFDLAQKGDPIAVKAFDRTGYLLGIKMADAVAHTSPEAIIFFGGLASAGDLLFGPTHRSMEDHLFGIFRGKVKLLQSGLKEDNAAVLGASALIWNELKKKK
jgi:glucokinase